MTERKPMKKEELIRRLRLAWHSAQVVRHNASIALASFQSKEAPPDHGPGTLQVAINQARDLRDELEEIRKAVEDGEL